MRWEQIPAARRQDDQTPRPANLSIAAWPAGTMRRSPAAITHPVLHPTMTLNNNGNGRNGASLGFEADLFKAADKLRGNMEPSDYKHVALGLIFLKYISDAFEARHAALLAEDAQAAEDRDEYLADNIFWVPKDARWSHLKAAAKRPEIGQLIDDAMRAIERDNESLKGVLPKDYARPALNKLMLGELIDLISGIALRQPSPPAPLPEGEGRATAQSSPLPLGEGGRRPGEGQVERKAFDLLGRVYEYFLSQFAGAEGKRGGEFYTPRSVVRVLVEMLEPYTGRVYDPCCGSGGMFVQSEKFVLEHGGRIGDIAIYGQESNYTTWRLAKMNLAVRGIDADIRWNNEGSFHRDELRDLRFDHILANPPFNISDWGGDRLREDPRWTFGVPPVGNANYAWLQHIHWHLAPFGTAGVVLANGSMSSNQSGEGEIRKAMVEADAVDCMVALPGQLFYSTQIPACLWFLARDKSNGKRRKETLRDRRFEVLFIDARNLGQLVDRTRRELSDADIQKIADTYHAWRSAPRDPHPGPLPGGEGEKTNYKGGFDFSGLVETTRELRKKQTPAEAVMWELLRNRQFMGLKFRRQHQIGEYVADFYCDEHRLVVELDGAIHTTETQARKDKTRDAYMTSLGLTVVRIPNAVLLADPKATLEQIAANLPSPPGRGVTLPPENVSLVE
jgi:type I restriction enzyme M protein